MKKRLLVFSSLLLFNICIFADSSFEACEETPMCSATVTKDGVTVVVRAPCEKIVGAVKAAIRALE